MSLTSDTARLKNRHTLTARMSATTTDELFSVNRGEAEESPAPPHPLLSAKTGLIYLGGACYLL
jgi:hypothetical protein